MPKKRNEGLKKVTLNLTRSTYERFQELYTKSGAGPAIRKLCDAHIAQVDGKIAAAGVAPLQIKLDQEDLA